MKVLIFITHGNIGGATNSVFWLAKGLKKSQTKNIYQFQKEKISFKIFQNLMICYDKNWI